MILYPASKLVLNTDLWHPVNGGNGAQGNLAGYRATNLGVDTAGDLVVTARHEPYTPQWAGDGTLDYTSGRTDTKGRLAVAAGNYLEAFVQVPFLDGIWAALWLVGFDEDTVGWPASGEIDILETRGSRFPGVWRNLHQPVAGGTSDKQWGWNQPNASTLVDPTVGHWYGVDWDGNGVRFYIDRRIVQTVTRTQFTAAGISWPYAKAMSVIANIAVGGLAGTPDPAVFPVTMTVGPLAVYPVAQRPLP